jgi:hypothetical protein
MDMDNAYSRDNEVGTRYRLFFGSMLSMPKNRCILRLVDALSESDDGRVVRAKSIAIAS